MVLKKNAIGITLLEKIILCFRRKCLSLQNPIRTIITETTLKENI